MNEDLINGFRYKLQNELIIETPAISPSVKLLVNIDKERGVKKYLLDNLQKTPKREIDEKKKIQEMSLIKLNHRNVDPLHCKLI